VKHASHKTVLEKLAPIIAAQDGHVKHQL